ncbi:hypothetical protein D3C87_1570850 [compost metagenome]
MQDAAIFAAAHNGVISRIARAVAGKLMVNFAFELILEHPRTAFFHRTGVSQGADFARAAHHIQLFRRFKQAHFMHPRTPVGHGRRCLKILAETLTQLVQRVEQDFIGVVVLALPVVNHVQAIEQQG